mgnify:CR=1 FL=1
MNNFQLLFFIFFSLPISANISTDYTCPEVTILNQSFCQDSNPTVGDLQPSDALWYSSNDPGATPLSGTTSLIDGTIYYAGDQAQTCTTRPQVTVVLTEQAYAGNDAISEECESDIQDLFPGIPEIWNYWEDMLDPGVPTNGIFNPSAQQLVTDYNSTHIVGYADFTTTYTVGDPGCQDSVDLTIRVYETADAGTDAAITLFNNDAPVNLKDYLGANVTQGGTWSVLGDGIFDPATDAEGDFTYTVDGCTGLDSAIVSVEVIPPGCPTVSDTIQSFCRSSLPGNKIADLTATDNGGGIAWYADNSTTTALGSDMDIEDGGVYYAGSIDGNNCIGNRIAVTVNFLDTPNSGKTTFLTFNSNDPMVDLRDLIEQTEPDWPVDSGGDLTPNTSAGGTIFTPALDGDWTGEKQVTHTVTSTSNCPNDTTIVYITINPQPNTGHRLVFLGTNEADAQNYLDNNTIQNEEGLIVNIWKPTQLELNSVYRINVDGENRFYYVNNVYSDPQSTPDLTLTSDTEIEQNLTIIVSSSTLQEVTDVGSITDKRLELQGGLTINNDHLSLDGSSMEIAHPVSVTASDSSGVNLLDGGLLQSNIQNAFQGEYHYKGDGSLGYLNTDTTSSFNLLSSDTTKIGLVSLQMDDTAIRIGPAAVSGGYYSLRQEVDSLSGGLKFRFEDSGVSPVSFKSDTTTVFTGQLQIGDSIASGYDLVVGGAMISESMVMKLQANWPDYVFRDEYKLPSLSSIKAYIEKHKHLSGLPSATEVAAKGLDIPETNRKLLEKVEELTLHLLELQKGLKELKLENKKINQLIEG